MDVSRFENPVNPDMGTPSIMRLYNVELVHPMDVTWVYRKLKETKDESPLGFLSTENGAIKRYREVFTACCMELPWRNNQEDISCVPEGVYPIQLVESIQKRFGNTFLVQDVPNRSGILFGHIGNYAGDVSKGFKSSSKGCLVMGLSHAKIRAQYGATNSGKTIEKFQSTVATLGYAKGFVKIRSV